MSKAKPTPPREYRAVDYERAYSRLCHLAALTSSGRVEAALDNLVLTSVALSPETAMRPFSTMAGAIQTLFGLAVPEDDVAASVARLVAKGRLSESDRGFSMPKGEQEVVYRRADEAAAVEREVRKEWLASIDSGSRSPREATDDQLWAALQGFTARVFRRHGAQTLLLLAPDLPFLAEGEGSLATFFEDSATEAGIVAPDLQFVRSAVELFFNTQSEIKTQYLSQLLDSTFTFYALTVDQATADFLRGQLQRLDIFLDTNFIFAVIGLGDDYFAEISAEVLDLIQRQNLPFGLYYHERTLREIEHTIAAMGEQLQAKRWSQALSAAAFTFGKETGALSGVELAYHRLNSEQPVDPDVFLEKYSHIEQLLSDQGFKIYREGGEPDYSVTEKGSLIADYTDYAKETRPDRPKRYEAIDHDVVVLLRVDRLRTSPRSILQAGAVFLTNDYLLHRYVWRRLRSGGEIGHTVLPRELLQVLRPFVRSNEDFDRRFVETFAIPEFRGLQRDLAETTAKVLSYLATYRDLREETALRILSDTVLRNQARTVVEGSPELGELVEAAVVADNSLLVDERERLREELASVQSEAQVGDQAHRTELADRAADIASLEARIAAQEDRDLAEREKRATADAAIEERTSSLELDLRRERELRETAERVAAERSERLKWALFALLAVLSTGAIGFLVVTAPIPWLANHEHRYGLGLAFSAIAVGICWLLAGRPYRGIVVVGLLLTGIFTIAQIIDTAGQIPTP